MIISRQAHVERGTMQITSRSSYPANHFNSVKNPVYPTHTRLPCNHRRTRDRDRDFEFNDMQDHKSSAAFIILNALKV